MLAGTRSLYHGNEEAHAKQLSVQKYRWKPCDDGKVMKRDSTNCESQHRFDYSLLRAIHEESPDGILVVDRQDIVVSHNHRFLEVWRIDPADIQPESATVIGNSDQPVLSAVVDRIQDREAFLKRVKELYDDPDAVDYCEIPLRDGRTIERHSTVLRGEQEEYLGRVWFFRDISERKRIENDLRQAQKLEAIGQLAAGIAHEINTPTQYVNDNTTFLKDSWSTFGPILSLARSLHQEYAKGGSSADTLQRLNELIASADLDYLLQEVPQAMEQALEGLQRVSKIVRAMKEFSHPDSANKTAVDMNHAIETTITVARNEWKYVAEVETRFDNELPGSSAIPENSIKSS
jgi:signal transduction histidine kinase